MRSLVDDIEYSFTEIVEECGDYDWDENHITYSLMRKFREKLSHRQVHYQGFSKIVDWLSFKNRGKIETTNGDITMLVNIQFSSGERLCGASFLEAKRDNGDAQFNALNVTQLERIHSESPYSHLLLYTKKRQDLPRKFPHDGNWKSYFWATPCNTAIPLLKQLTPAITGRLLRVTMPFSMLLTQRYFWGLDLDYRLDERGRAIGGLENLLTRADYLAIVNVYYDGQQPILPELPGKWDSIT
jgi:hypothetical protein